MDGACAGWWEVTDYVWGTLEHTHNMQNIAQVATINVCHIVECAVMIVVLLDCCFAAEVWTVLFVVDVRCFKIVQRRFKTNRRKTS